MADHSPPTAVSMLHPLPTMPRTPTSPKHLGSRRRNAPARVPSSKLDSATRKKGHRSRGSKRKGAQDRADAGRMEVLLSPTGGHGSPHHGRASLLQSGMVSKKKSSQRKAQGKENELAAWSQEQGQFARSIAEEAWTLDLGAIRLAAYTEISAPKAWRARVICAGFVTTTLKGTYATRAEAMRAAEMEGMMTLLDSLYTLRKARGLTPARR